MSQGGGSQGDGGFKKINNENSLIPITIKQWLQAPNTQADGGNKIDNRTINQIQIVGSIRSMTPQATNTTYQIDDSTGVIDVKQWTSDKDQGPKFQNGQYVRVVGRLNVFQERRTISAFKIFPITDFNEVTCHFLQVIEAHIFAKGIGAAPAQAAGGTMQANFNQQAFPKQQQNMGGGGMQNAAPYGQQAGGFAANTAMADDQNFSPLQRQVLDAILQADQATGSEEGVHIEKVFAQLDPTGGKINDIRGAVEHLTNEGHLYSTIDEEHFKATTS